MHSSENNIGWQLVYVKWSLFLVSILWADEFVWKFSWLSTREFINEYIYWHATGKI